LTENKKYHRLRNNQNTSLVHQILMPAGGGGGWLHLIIMPAAGLDWSASWLPPGVLPPVPFNIIMTIFGNHQTPLVILTPDHHTKLICIVLHRVIISLGQELVVVVGGYTSL